LGSHKENIKMAPNIDVRDLVPVDPRRTFTGRGRLLRDTGGEDPFEIAGTIKERLVPTQEELPFSTNTAKEK
jgi:hypothetical protein